MIPAMLAVLVIYVVGWSAKLIWKTVRASTRNTKDIS
jgi:hypothetical protein